MLFSALLALLALPGALGGVTTDASRAANQTFDYVILGGGTAGLALANRLSEDPAVTVLVVEAGPDNRTSPLVDDIKVFGSAIGSALDWGYKTVDGRSIGGGKTLGGSSSINGGTWTRGMRAQYDAFAALLEPGDAHKGWDWAGLFHYMKKAELFAPPNRTQRALGADAVAAYHGFDGHVHAAFPTGMFAGPGQGYFLETVQNLTGIKHLPDLAGGDANCVTYVPVSLNKYDNDSRSSSAQAYLTPVERTRTNWLTLVEHSATRILFANASTSPLVATGVQFAATPRVNASVSPEVFTAYAAREVILAAGAIRTPALLQLSGIGDAGHLGSLGIETLVDLPTVGKNLQEQTNTPMLASGVGVDPRGVGPNNIIAYPNVYELFGANATTKVAEIKSQLSTWAATQAHNAYSQKALRKILALQASAIVDHDAPVFEMFYAQGIDAIGSAAVAMWNLLPFSRGNVSITSTDPFVPPAVNVNWFDVPFDMDVQVAGTRLVRDVFSTPPTSTILAQELLPGFDAVPSNATDAQWATWIRSAFSANSHPIATAAMMRRDLGGVVDAELRVYDTANLRVVDASVLPIQLSAHLSATVYGVAEKAADIIKSSYKD